MHFYIKYYFGICTLNDYFAVFILVANSNIQRGHLQYKKNIGNSVGTRWNIFEQVKLNIPSIIKRILFNL